MAEYLYGNYTRPRRATRRVYDPEAEATELNEAGMSALRSTPREELIEEPQQAELAPEPKPTRIKQSSPGVTTSATPQQPTTERRSGAGNTGPSSRPTRDIGVTTGGEYKAPPRQTGDIGIRGDATYQPKATPATPFSDVRGSAEVGQTPKPQMRAMRSVNVSRQDQERSQQAFVREAFDRAEQASWPKTPAEIKGRALEQGKLSQQRIRQQAAMRRTEAPLQEAEYSPVEKARKLGQKAIGIGGYVNPVTLSAGLLTGEDPGEIANQLYGGFTGGIIGKEIDERETGPAAATANIAGSVIRDYLTGKAVPTTNSLLRGGVVGATREGLEQAGSGGFERSPLEATGKTLASGFTTGVNYAAGELVPLPKLPASGIGRTLRQGADMASRMGANYAAGVGTGTAERVAQGKDIGTAFTETATDPQQLTNVFGAFDRPATPTKATRVEPGVTTGSLPSRATDKNLKASPYIGPKPEVDPISNYPGLAPETRGVIDNLPPLSQMPPDVFKTRETEPINLLAERPQTEQVYTPSRMIGEVFPPPEAFQTQEIPAIGGKVEDITEPLVRPTRQSTQRIDVPLQRGTTTDLGPPPVDPNPMSTLELERLVDEIYPPKAQPRAVDPNAATGEVTAPSQKLTASLPLPEGFTEAPTQKLPPQRVTGEEPPARPTRGQGRPTGLMPQVERASSLNPDDQVLAKIAGLPPEERAQLEADMERAGIGLIELRRLIDKRDSLTPRDILTTPPKLTELIRGTPKLSQATNTEALTGLEEFPGAQLDLRETIEAGRMPQEAGKERNIAMRDAVYTGKPTPESPIAERRLEERYRSAPDTARRTVEKGGKQVGVEGVKENRDAIAKNVAARYATEEDFIAAVSKKALKPEERKQIEAILSVTQGAKPGALMQMAAGSKERPGSLRSLYRHGKGLLAKDPNYRPVPFDKLGLKTAGSVTSELPTKPGQPPTELQAPIKVPEQKPAVVEAKQEADAVFGKSDTGPLVPRKEGEILAPQPKRDRVNVERIAPVQKPAPAPAPIPEGPKPQPKLEGGLPKATPDNPTPEKAFGKGHIFQNVDPREIDIAPDLLQFKQKVGKGGATPMFSDVDWNSDVGAAGIVTVWRNPEDGRILAVNGHHRRQIAINTLERGKPVENFNVRFLDAPNAKEARIRGGLLNMAEGSPTMTSTDVAGVIREGNFTEQELRDRGISLKNPTVQDGLIMSKLDEGLYNQVRNGKIPENQGVAIAKAFPNDTDLQWQLYETVEGKRTSAEEIAEIGALMKGAPIVEDIQQGLFGDMSSKQSLLKEMAGLSNSIRQQLSSDKRFFSKIGNEKAAERAGKAGNVLNVEENKRLAEMSDEALGFFDRLRTSEGPINRALQEGALAIKGKEDAAKVRAETYEKVAAAIRAEIDSAFAGAKEGVSGRSGGDNQANPVSSGGLFSEQPDAGANRSYSQKLRDIADEWDAKADAILNRKDDKSGPESGSSSIPSDLAAVAYKGAAMILRAGAKGLDYASFASAMVKQYGNRLKQEDLPKIYERSKDIAKAEEVKLRPTRNVSPDTAKQLRRAAQASLPEMGKAPIKTADLPSTGPIGEMPKKQKPLFEEYGPKQPRAETAQLKEEMAGRGPNPPETEIRSEQQSLLPPEKQKAGVLQAVSGLRKANMLSSFSAAAKDIVGTNIFVAAKNIAEKPFSVAADVIMPKLAELAGVKLVENETQVKATRGGKEVTEVVSTPRRNRRSQANLTATQYKEWLKGTLVDGYKGFKDVWTGKDEKALNKALQRLDHQEIYTGESIANKALDNFINYTMRGRAAADQFAFKGALNMAIAERANLRAMEMKGQQGAYTDKQIIDLTKKFIKNEAMDAADRHMAESVFTEAAQDAAEATFNNDNGFAVKAAEIKGRLYGEQGKNKRLHHAAGFVLDQLVPFTRVPSNVAIQTFKRLPGVGPLEALGRAGIALKKGTMTAKEQRAITDAIGRGALSTAMAGLAIILGQQGMITEQTPYTPVSQEGEDKRNLNEAAGRLSGAVKVGDTWFDDRTLGIPVALLSLNYQLYKDATKPDKKGEEEGALSKTGRAVTGLGKTLALSHPLTKGVGEFAGMVGEEGGPERFLAKSALATVPVVGSSMMNDIAPFAAKLAGKESLKRYPERFSKDMGRAILENIQENTPIWREELPAARDAFGSTIENPMFFRTSKDTETIRTLDRLDKGLSKPQRRDKETPEEYERRSAVLGKVYEQNLDKLTGSAPFRMGTDEQQGNMLDLARSQSREGETRIKPGQVLKAVRKKERDEPKKKREEEKKLRKLERRVM